MSEFEILNAAILQANNGGENPFAKFMCYNQSILNDNSPLPYLELIRITCEYLNPYFYPFITGEKRIEWLQQRLDKFKIKYIESI